MSAITAQEQEAQMLDTAQIATQVHDLDFYQWVQTTIENIQRGAITAIDWDYLVEELQDLGNEQKNQLESRLLVLYEHLLKLTYWSQERDYNQRGWRATILEQRKQLKRLLNRSPSLKPYFQEVAQEIYDDACQITSVRTGLNANLFPPSPIANIEQVLNEDWLPELKEDC
ncbi:DUF29 domain-containing protein [Aphanizomenon sp. CS-733/32]|uniref:DUF29 domain-containing protein n=1 Tax=Aphanizomenon sp. CS-733/32 TaxID=3021715 RepID=UPI00232D8203|nr:DUF29 domain-containing protein [Aphanizomenon sp. CS-733/32]MDB9307454.1 DUF29 domain-containing protein [Aphanizomenon sp. CS-733/32]